MYRDVCSLRPRRERREQVDNFQIIGKQSLEKQIHIRREKQTLLLPLPFQLSKNRGRRRLLLLSYACTRKRGEKFISKIPFSRNEKKEKSLSLSQFSSVIFLQ
jgi:hypothetical protein